MEDERQLVALLREKDDQLKAEKRKRKRVQRTLAEFRAEMALMQKISTAVQASLDLDQVLELVLQHFTSQGYDRVRVFLYDEKQQAMIGKMQAGLDPRDRFEEIVYPIATDPYTLRTMVSEKANIYRTDTEEYKALIKRRQEAGEINVPIKENLEWCELPLKVIESEQEHFIGKIGMDNIQSGVPLEQERLDKLMVYASQIAIAIRKAQLYQQVSNYAEDLEAKVQLRTTELVRQVGQQRVLANFNMAVQQMKTPADLEEILVLFLKEIEHLGINAQAMAVHRVISEESGLFESIRVGHNGLLAGIDRSRNLSFRDKWRKGEVVFAPSLKSFLEKETLNVVARTEGFFKKFGDLPIQSFVDIPLSWGVLSVHSFDQSAFGDADVEQIQILGEVLSVGLVRLEDLERLNQSNKMEAVGKLAGGIAHDFNNLLTVINGHCKRLVAKIDNEYVAATIGEIQKAGERAASLTYQLLAFSRRQTLQPQELNINRAISEMSQLLRGLIGETVDLTTNLGAQRCSVMVDPGQFNQVVMNFVVNARDAMPAGGQLVIQTEDLLLDHMSAGRHDVAPGHYVVLTVSDNGEGIPLDIQERIFEPFFTTRKLGEGTGMGLSTVHGIVAQSGGFIDVESEVGLGSTFRVYLPSVPDRAIEDDGPSEPSSARVEGKTVLVVEDEEMVLQLVHQVLESEGFRVVAAGSGEEALVACANLDGKLDLVLTDVIMPGMGGRELVQKLQSQQDSLQVIYMSGYTDNDIGRQGVLEDDVVFVQKPFDPDELVNTVKVMFEKS